MGFLTEATPERVVALLRDGRYDIQRRMRIRGDVRAHARSRVDLQRAQRLVVHSTGYSRMVRLRVEVGGKLLREFSADGLIIATPPGSTAYSLSAGGPVVEPGLEAIVVTPVCPHTLGMRALVLPPSLEVRVAIRSRDGAGAIVSLDGLEGIPIGPRDLVRIALARDAVASCAAPATRCRSPCRPSSAGPAPRAARAARNAHRTLGRKPRDRRARAARARTRQLTALSGETGAGKSLLVGALTLLVGGRAELDAIRTGESRARLEARFQVASGPARALLESWGIPCDDGEVVLRREVAREGKSRAWINQTSVTVAALAELGRVLLEVHGQHEHQHLLHPTGNADVLDRWADLSEARLECARAHSLASATDARIAVRRGVSRAAAEADAWAFAHEELERAGLRAGEDEELASSWRASAMRPSYAGAGPRARRARRGALRGTTEAERALREAAQVDPALAALAEELATARLTLTESLRAVESALIRGARPAEAEAAEARHALLERLLRRHHRSLPELIAYRDELAARLTRVENAEGERTRLAEEETHSALRLDTGESARPRAARGGEAPRTATRRDELSALGLAQAKLTVTFEPLDPPASHGAEKLELSFAPNPGRPRGRWRGSPRAASCRASCSRWKPCWPRPTAFRRCSSTRSTRASAARSRARWASALPRCRACARCCASRISLSSRRRRIGSSDHQGARQATERSLVVERVEGDDASRKSRACSRAMPPRKRRAARPRSCSRYNRAAAPRAAEESAHVRLPAVFLSHGAPTLAIESHQPTHGFLKGLGKAIGAKPRAIVCVSAHWEARQPTLGASTAPATIHDFYGFPEALYRIRYGAPGDPALAARARDLLGEPESKRRSTITAASITAPGCRFAGVPQAEVPVVQLSVQSALGAAHHVALGRALAPLRDEGMLILGSGGATHDLRRAALGGGADAPVPADVRAFEEWLVQGVEAGATAELVAWRERAPHALGNHPTPEHLLPLFVPFGATSPGNERTGAPSHVRLWRTVDGGVRLGLAVGRSDPAPGRGGCGDRELRIQPVDEDLVRAAVGPGAQGRTVVTSDCASKANAVWTQTSVALSSRTTRTRRALPAVDVGTTACPKNPPGFRVPSLNRTK